MVTVQEVDWDDYAARTQLITFVRHKKNLMSDWWTEMGSSGVKWKSVNNRQGQVQWAQLTVHKVERALFDSCA